MKRFLESTSNIIPLLSIVLLFAVGFLLLRNEFNPTARGVVDSQTETALPGGTSPLASQTCVATPYAPPRDPRMPAATEAVAVISRVTDLAPNPPQNAKLQIIVFHCDGMYEKFLTDNEQKIPLQSGDHIGLTGRPITNTTR